MPIINLKNSKKSKKYAKVTYKDATGTEVNAFSSSALSVILD